MPQSSGHRRATWCWWSSNHFVIFGEVASFVILSERSESKDLHPFVILSERSKSKDLHPFVILSERSESK
ncbi:MAG: hypothetical protein ABI969_11485, partial [bacterium]